MDSGDRDMLLDLFTKLPEILREVINAFLETYKEPLTEPDEVVQEGDNIIGPVSEQTARLWVAYMKEETAILANIENGMEQLARKLKGGQDTDDLTNGTDLEKATHPVNQALCGSLLELFKHAVIHETLTPAGCLRDEILLRKGFIAVWRKPEPEPEQTD